MFTVYGGVFRVLLQPSGATQSPLPSVFRQTSPWSTSGAWTSSRKPAAQVSSSYPYAPTTITSENAACDLPVKSSSTTSNTSPMRRSWLYVSCRVMSTKREPPSGEYPSDVVRNSPTAGDCFTGTRPALPAATLVPASVSDGWFHSSRVGSVIPALCSTVARSTLCAGTVLPSTRCSSFVSSAQLHSVATKPTASTIAGAAFSSTTSLSHTFVRG